MIKLQKLPEPKVLSDNAVQWLSELKAALEIDDKAQIKAAKRKYGHASIKDVLKQETHGKCAYCEVCVVDAAYGDIEHINPKSPNVDLTFEWRNLTYSCEVCNTHKSNKDPTDHHLLDPYENDPSAYIRFIGPIINGEGTDFGTCTIHHLKLDRAELTESRLRVFKELIKNLDNIKRARTEVERRVLIDDFIQNELGDSLEFSAMRRDFWLNFDPRVV